MILLCTGSVLFYFSLPQPLFKNPYSYILLDRHGELLQARIAGDGQWRFPGSDEVPEKFAKALIAFEDNRFYYHPGVDPAAIIRAACLNISNRKVLSGGSTLSMQVMRLARNKPRTFFQKIIEMVLAVRLECSYSKREILALYAHHAPFGGNVVGLRTAAWRYFGRDAAMLSWGEAASLAVLPNNPSMVRPDRNRGVLLAKRNQLLNVMERKGIIDHETCRLAKQEPVPQKPLPLPEAAPHLLTSIANNIYHNPHNDPVVHSTIDAKLQASVIHILEQHHVALAANGIQNLAALVMDVESGDVVSYVGNIYHAQQPVTEQYVDMIPSKRSPGSTLKPLLYAAMLQDGLILPHSLIADIPTQIAGYSPQNFDRQHDGAVPASKALGRSLNIPAIRMLQQYRIERFYNLVNRLGIHSLNKGADHYGLSVILGGGENSMWELAGVYASLARLLNHYTTYSGHYNDDDVHEPNVFLRQKHHPPLTPKQWQQMPTDFLPGAGSIYNTFEAMQDIMRPGDEYLWSQFTSSKHIAWKTGTSFGFRDGWAIGITPKQVVVVWAGNADGEGRPALTGISTAAPVLFNIFRRLPEAGWFEPPYDDLERKVTCRQSGFPASPLCEQTDTIYCVKQRGTLSSCSYHQLIHTDMSGKYRVSSECASPNAMLHQSWFVLPPAMEWFYKNHDASYKTLPPWKAGCTSSQSGVMEMIYPKKSTAIYVPVELDGESGRCVFEVAHRNKDISIHWHLDEKYLGSTQAFHRYGLNPAPGRHMLTLVDANGERLEQFFEVIEKK